MTKFNLYFPRRSGEGALYRGHGEVDLCVTGCLGIGYELSPKGAGKDDGLRALCDHLGIPVARAMAVGDGNNDIGLMRCRRLLRGHGQRRGPPFASWPTPSPTTATTTARRRPCCGTCWGRE